MVFNGDNGVCTLKEGAAVTPSKTRSKSSRESAVTKEQEKKSRESQRTKKRTLLRVSSTSDCSKSTQDQHQETLELIRKQRQGEHTHTHTHSRSLLCCSYFTKRVCLCMNSCAAWQNFVGSSQPTMRWFWGSGSTQTLQGSLSKPSALSYWELRDNTSCSAEEFAPTPPSAKTTGESNFRF